MARYKRKEFTVDLKIRTDEARKKLEMSVNDMKEMLADLAQPFDKMRYFKDFVDYIGQMDKALTALETKHKGKAREIFEGVDTGLKEAAGQLIGATPESLSAINHILDKLGKTDASKVKSAELKQFAQYINALYGSLGKEEQLNIEDFSPGGKGKQFTDKQKVEKIDILKDALLELIKSMDVVTDRVKNGFGFGVGVSDDFGVGEYFKAIADIIKNEIGEIEEQIDRYQNILNNIPKIKNIRDYINDRANIDDPDAGGMTQDAFDEKYKNWSPSKDAEESIEKTIALFKEYSRLRKELESIDDVDSDEYRSKNVEFLNAAGKLFSTLEKNTSYEDKTKDWAKKFREYGVSEDDLAGIFGKSVENGVHAMFDDVKFEIEEYFYNFDDEVADVITTSAQNTIEKLEPQLANAKETIGQKIQEALNGGGSGSGDGSGSGSGGGKPDSDAPQKAAIAYDELIGKLREYQRLIKKQDDGFDFDDDGAQLQKKVDDLDEYFESLTEDATELRKIQDIIGNAGYNYNDITPEQAVENLRKILNITEKINTATTSASGSESGAIAASTSEKTISDLEYTLALAGQLKDMFATMSRRTDFEYNISVNGLDIKALKGKEKHVGYDTQVGSYLDNLFSPFTAYGHSHRGGSKAFNTTDILQYLDEYKNALNSFSFVVGSDGIETLNFGGIDVADIEKIKNELTALGKDKNAPLNAKEINQIVEKITGVKNVLRTWKPDQVDELAQYMYEVSKNAEAAIDPAKKLQMIFDSFFGAGKVDVSKHGDLLAQLNKDNAKNIFNQIASKEGLVGIDGSSSMSMKQVSSEMDKRISEYERLRSEAQLTYSTIKEEVDKVLEAYKNGGTQNSQMDFFRRFFPEGEWQKYRDLIAQAYDGLISVEEVQNRIADKFFIDQDTYDKIPTGHGNVEDRQQDANAQLQSFFKLANEASAYWSYDAEGNVEIGKYIERLETAKKALEELGQQGLISSEKLNEINEIFNHAKMSLDMVTSHAYGYGHYDYSYEDELDKARAENDDLRAENERLRQSVVSSSAPAQTTDVDGAVKEKTGAFEQEGQVVDQVVDQEKIALGQLIERLEEVKKAVQAKTKAFYDEGTVVGQAVGKEIAALIKLKDELNNIETKINHVVDGISNINTNVSNVGSDKLKDNSDEKEKRKQDSHETKPKTADEIAKMAAQKIKERELQKIQGQVNLERGTLGFNFNARNLEPEQKEIVDLYDKLVAEMDKYDIAVKNGQQAELKGIDDIKAALFEKIDAYKEANNIINAGKTGGKKAPGATVVKNATTKYSALKNLASTEELKRSQVVQQSLAQYKDAWQNLVSIQGKYKTGQILSKDQEQEFNDARVACNNYAKDLEKLLKTYQKSKDSGDPSKRYELEGDFYDTNQGRQKAFQDFLDQIYGADVTFEKFDDNFNKMVYTVDNGDGTFTKMTATINSTRTAIDVFAGETKKSTTALERWIDGLKNKFATLSQYLAANFGLHEVWQQIKQGVQHVREIDSALTELKKVTDETDATYDSFLQSMSKTAGVVGSTVKDLTTMSADWARLGYSIEDSARLAESTAILLNVSEFDNATEASEALISTMQAFQYTADESQHVVDILNEVGNNYAVSSDGIATALQDSASALMEGGNNLEQATALVAAANKVVQDPSSVGSALRTISLRLRGTSVEILEQMGEETDNVAESTSKLQEKLKALTGVDILTDAGAYKDTYTILKEIGEVWQDIDPMDQAAALELMAGKNRANTLAAILNNMEDLKGAYNDALGAEGSALKENAAYLDSIQGRIDLFNNSVQTMWMNFIDDDVVKFLVNVATAAIKLVDAIGLIPTAVGAFATYKFAAKDLKELFDGTSVSAKELRKQVSEYIVQQTEAAAASEATAAAKTSEAAATATATQADAAEAASSATNAGANMTQAEASNAVQKEKTEEAVAVNNAARADAAEAATSVANGASGALSGIAGIASKAGAALKVVGVALGKAALLMAIVKVATWALSKAWEEFDKNVVHRAENIKQEVSELKDTYEEAKKSFDENLNALTTSSDASVYKTLQDEFSRLANGVDEYGNNISLTSSQYERYKQICEQIVGINPSLAAGYDSATKAIGNNASVLSDLIRLQKESIRLNAEEYVNDENLAKHVENAKNSYHETLSSNRTNTADAYGSAWSNISKALGGTVKNSSDNASIDDEMIAYILEKSGWAEEEARKIADQYVTRVHGEAGEVLTDKFLEDYYDAIIANTDKFGGKYTNTINAALSGVKKAILSNDKDLKEANDELVNTFLQVPNTLIGAEYDQLNDASKKFVTEYIKNANPFKVDYINGDEDIAEESREKIQDLIKDIANNNFKKNLDGKEINGQDVLDQIYNFDPSTVNWGDYKSQMNALIEELWVGIGELENEYGFKDIHEFKAVFGIDFEVDEEKINKANEYVQNHVDIEANEIQSNLDRMNAKQIKAYYSINWNEVDWGNVTSWSDVMDLVNKQMQIDNIVSVKTYSELTSSVESYNEILSQTSEIVADNTEVTQEYKDSLKELGISEEELNECFDEANPLIVKNASALNKLVKSSKNNVAQNVKLAKSHTRLKYYDLVKQLNSTLKGTNSLNNSTKKAINTTLQQINAVQQALYKYQLLEDSILGTTNAFEKFSQAQEVDSLNTYGDSYVEMAQTIYDAYYKTGEVGSEVVEAAVEAIIDPSVYSKLEKNSDAYHQAIFDAFNKHVLPNFTVNEDNFSLEYENIEKFVDDNLGTLFTGTSIKDFDLVEGMSLDDAVELTGKTKTEIYAMFAELKKYSGVDYLSMLDDSLEGRITNITSDIEELNRQKLALLEDGGYDANKEQIDEINQKLAENEQKLDAAGNEAYTMWQQYTQNDAALAALSEIEDKQKVLTSEEAGKLGIQLDPGQTITVQEAYDRLLAKQAQLEEPTELIATLAIESIDTKIAELQQKLKEAENDPTVLGLDVSADQQTIDKAKADIQTQMQALEEDKVAIATTFNIALSEEEKASLQEELSAIEQFKINDKEFTVIANGTSETMKAMQEVEDFVYTDKSFTTTEYKETVTTNRVVTQHENSPSYSAAGSGRVRGYTKANGTAHAQGSWGAPRTETALVGELGPELLVRDGRWTTVGENGAEFTGIKKGDIVFNHKQTEELLKNGYVTGRGKAYASGTAYAGLWAPARPDDTWSSNSSLDDVSDDLSDAADSISDAADEFEEVFDWIEVRLEEIEEQLSLLNANLENAVGYESKNAIIDSMIAVNGSKLNNLQAGAIEYAEYASKLLTKIPAQYQEAAQNGAIAIKEFAGEADEATVEAINNYREWAQKVADLKQQLEEVKTEIQDLAKQKFDNVSDEYDNIISLIESANEKLDAQVSLMEDSGYVASKKYYESMVENTKKQNEELKKEKAALQSVLDEQVKLGNIKVGSEAWYEMVGALYEVDLSIMECSSELESFQNAINDIYWDNFDQLINCLDYLKDETQGLIDLMDSDDMVADPQKRKYENGTVEYWTSDDVAWTDEGLASLGLYAQQMEIAEYKSRQYAQAIDDLTKDFNDGKYSENEYLEKLNELTNAQYDSIEAYYDAQDAIKDLNETRIDSIKEGIEAEIDAYSELIDKQKELLDSEKDLHDFQKSVAEQEKNISDIKRKLAAIENDNSISATAQRKKLQAELAEAEYELEEMYYDRSVEDKQTALDKELESFQEEKDAEITKWEEYLDNIETVVADSLTLIQANASGIYDTLNQKANEYDLTLSESITTPWKDGALAVSDYQTAFDTAMSSTMDKLEGIKLKWQDIIDKMNEAAATEINNQTKENNRYVTPQQSTTTSNTTSSGTSGYDSYTVQKGDTLWDIAAAKLGDATRWREIYDLNTDVISNPDLIYPGQKLKLPKYAKGTLGTSKDQFAWIDELGDELIIRPQNGRMTFLEKGTGVVPADLTANLMEWGKLDPSIMLEQNRPVISAPQVINNNMEISMEISEVVHIDTVTQDTIPDLTKAINKQLDKYMTSLNGQLRKYSR